MAHDNLFEDRRMILESLRFSYKHAIDPKIGAYARDRTQIEFYKDQTNDRLVYEINTAVLAEKLVDKTVTREAFFRHEVRYPASWWQHFKRDVLSKSFLTRWFVKWRPVRHTTVSKQEKAVLEVDFRQYAKFPAADIVTPPGIHKHVVVPHEEMNVYINKGPLG